MLSRNVILVMFTFFVLVNNKDTTEEVKVKNTATTATVAKNLNNNDKKAAFMNVVHKPRAKNAIMY